jgi:putative acetyltransferase
MHIREFQAGDEAGLYAVFFSAIHDIASQDYTPEQIQAWAPASIDPELWAQRLQAIRPFVVESGGVPIGYADLQPSGYIDHFFVSGPHARQGIGTRLMHHIQQTARHQRILALTSHVSLTAQPFFARFGFTIVEHRQQAIRGVVVPNALMRCDMIT